MLQGQDDALEMDSHASTRYDAVGDRKILLLLLLCGIVWGPAWEFSTPLHPGVLLVLN